LHLALGKKARMMQLDYIGEVVRSYQHVVVMGDMNCQPDSDELSQLHEKTGLTSPDIELKTYPSWKPSRHLDHILVSPSLQVERMEALQCTYSDHLPISMEVVVPQAVRLVA
jgi:endonuclease/exonuclease/phosphatase family metal-dependent hydrolase